jgi:hypothetical protein
MRLKKQLSVECFLRGLRDEAKETVECRMFSTWSTRWGWRNSWMSNVFYVDYGMSLKKQLHVEYFLQGVRDETEETVECRMFSTCITSWCRMKCWVSNVFYVVYELRLKKQLSSLSRTSRGWINSWVSNASYVEYELRLKKQLRICCFLCEERAEAKERV